MNTSSAFILFLCIALSLLLIYNIRNVESLGFPFNTLHNCPVTKEAKPYYKSFCTDDQRNIVPCDIPCSESNNPACKFAYPVPVLGVSSGSSSPSVWCPGPPLC
jgi:hypothetical protein